MGFASKIHRAPNYMLVGCLTINGSPNATFNIQNQTADKNKKEKKKQRTPSKV